MAKYKHLFSPIVLGGQYFRNRIFNSPTGACQVPFESFVSYYERKAMGGAAAVCIGDACPSPDGMARPGQIRLWDKNTRPNLIEVAYAIRRHGAVPSMEIVHGGNCSYYAHENGYQPYGPVAGLTPFGQEIREVPEEVILQYIEAFARAAAFAKSCGYGMVTVHGGHGWLLTQFFAKTNNRRDKWGGTPENRARLAVAICDRIHQVCGRDFPVEIRITGSEVYEGGYGIETGIEQAVFLDGHADLIHVSAGSHEVDDVFTVTHPSMFLPDGVNVKFAAEIKKHVRQTPVATVGALSEPELLEEIIASGKADVVELARGLICDPDLPAKLQAGRDDEVRKCMRCLWCFSHRMQREKIVCALNPEIGNEAECKNSGGPAAVRKKVLIVGGGVAGMQAALTCAERGHSVILCEKQDRLGGVLPCEEKGPFKEKLGQYLALQARLIERNRNIQLFLETEVTPAAASNFAPDVIVAALGSRPVVPGIPGIDRENVFPAQALFRRPELAGKRVVILGGGLVGMELAVYLSMLGRECTILELQPELNDGGNNLHGLALSQEFRKFGIRISTATKAVEINDRGVVGQFTGCLPQNSDRRFGLPAYYPEAAAGSKLFACDTVVYAVGQVPLRAEAEALRDCAGEFHLLGDCVTPANIWYATTAAYFLGRNIGRC